MTAARARSRTYWGATFAAAVRELYPQMQIWLDRDATPSTPAEQIIYRCPLA
jgi:hypothetical protein